jgi:hypothetical protein
MVSTILGKGSYRSGMFCSQNFWLCFCCGSAEFALSEIDLHPLIARPLESVYNPDAYSLACDQENFDDWVILHPENGIGFLAALER